MVIRAYATRGRSVFRPFFSLSCLSNSRQSSLSWSTLLLEAIHARISAEFEYHTVLPWLPRRSRNIKKPSWSRARRGVWGSPSPYTNRWLGGPTIPSAALPALHIGRTPDRKTQKRPPRALLHPRGRASNFWCNRGLSQRPRVTIPLVQPSVLSIAHWARGVKDEV